MIAVIAGAALGALNPQPAAESGELRACRPLLLLNAAGAGDIQATATFGTQIRAGTLQRHCGE